MVAQEQYKNASYLSWLLSCIAYPDEASIECPEEYKQRNAYLVKAAKVLADEVAIEFDSKLQKMQIKIIKLKLELLLEAIEGRA